MEETLIAADIHRWNNRGPASIRTISAAAVIRRISITLAAMTGIKTPFRRIGTKNADAANRNAGAYAKKNADANN